MRAVGYVAALALVLFAALALPVEAHPHIFIDAKATIVFDDHGYLKAIRNAWTFDEAFSVWQTQGLDTNGDHIISSAEMQDLADDNLKGLAEYGFYTSAGEGKEALDFVSNNDAKFVYQNQRSTLTFSISPAQPYRVRDKLELSIADPEYYVAISFNKPSDVTLENAPKGCGVQLQPGRDMPPDLAAKLFAIPADVTKLPKDLEIALRGVQGSILLTCPPGAAAATPEPAEAPATALEAVNQAATGKVIPFGGPPAEPGLILPRTGFLGWVAQMQQDFYQALTAALARLKTDYTGFWVLGGLSFLYGVFHSAGPGHGKVVISSYMLANEAQVRHGILLSFASAMLQSVTAIVFVGIAAMLIGLSSIAMGQVANWIGIASYGLVMLLGAWLIIRKLFGFGHSYSVHHHEEGRNDLRAAAHAHLHAPIGGAGALAFETGGHGEPGDIDAWGRMPGHRHFGHDHGEPHHHHHGEGGGDAHEDDHHHFVSPAALRGDWKEQLGVVVGVGLRPCSGALIVLVFALSQGILLAGIAAVLLMGVGTAITTSTLATIATTAKGLARRFMGRESRITHVLLWWAELLGAVLVFLFGLVLVLASI